MECVIQEPGQLKSTEPRIKTTVLIRFEFRYNQSIQLGLRWLCGILGLAFNHSG